MPLNSTEDGSDFKNKTEPVTVLSFIHNDAEYPNSPTSTIILPKKSSSFKRNQYLAALAANFGAIELGATFGWTATALPYLRDDSHKLITSTQQESWIFSLIMLGALVGGPPGGYCNERFGRRMTMILLTVPGLVAWALIYFAQNVEMIYVGRLLLGFVGGAFTVAAPIYIAETADPDIRGKMSVGFDMGICIGVLIVQVIAAFTDWKWQTLASALLTAIGHILLMLVPETPRYLISKGKMEEAKKSMAWLKNTTSEEVFEEELKELKQSMAETKDNNGSKNQLTLLLQPHVLKPLMISILLHFTAAMSGVSPIGAFTVDIFDSAGTHLDAFLSTVILAIFALFSALFSAAVVDKCGRRPLLIAAQLIMTLALTAMGGYYFVKRHNDGAAPAYLEWVPITSLGLFEVAFAFGIGPLCYTIQGEILPPEAKGIGSSAITTVRYLTSFLTSQFFVQILANVGEDVGYWLFAGFCFLGFVYVTLFVPETKGRTLEEIQNVYIKKKQIKP